MPEVPLGGCTPEPLMNYLKALGILRLVSEQVDPTARGCWRNDTFILSSPLDRQGLIGFFLDQYQPTPIVAPWAGGSGFFEKDNQEAVNGLGSPEVSPRCRQYHQIIGEVRRILQEEEISDKPKGRQKDHLLRRYRRELPLSVVEWIDAAMVIQETGQAFAPLLGTGGNDGRLDFTQNFMARLVRLRLHEPEPAHEAEAWCEQALFASPMAGFPSASVGQFAPGRAGGPNATQGMEGGPLDNPWDFILMMEGAICLAGAAVRRFGLAGALRASFPFTVRSSTVGFASTADKDEDASRGEIWLPVWSRPTRLPELRALLGEGRTVVGTRVARDGIGFARAVATLGVDRGIDEFVRLTFLKRSGKAFLATPTGRFKVPQRAWAGVDLLHEIDPWLDRFRAACGDRSTPERLTSALRRIHGAIFDFCRYGGKKLFQAILVALGRAERECAVSVAKIGERTVLPVPPLSCSWVRTADYGTVEFELARSRAGIHDRENRHR